jgi:trk system potassium uptake protein TrkH
MAVIGLLAWSRFKGESIPAIWGRSIPEETIQRAVGLFVVVFGMVTAAILVLSITESGRVEHGLVAGNFFRYMFEAASAFNTVGLSMGLTPSLSPAGKWIIIALMFLGRVGPLTFAAAIALRASLPYGGFRYAYEDVVIG